MATVEYRKHSKNWYARVVVDGARKCIPLSVRVEGVRPLKRLGLGDVVFERSRAAAMAAAEKLEGDLVSKDAEYHLKMYQLLTARRVGRTGVALDGLYAAWAAALPPGKENGKSYHAAMKAYAADFAGFIQGKWPQVATAAGVTHDMAMAWLQGVQARGVTAATYSRHLIMMRSLFKRIGSTAGLLANPFAGFPVMDTREQVHRRPYTEKELEKIVAAADPMMRGPIITAICTAMRRADCCLLEWKDVDLKAGYVEVVTAKTGERAEIPLLPLLKEELAKAPRTDRYCWPEAAAMAKVNPSGLTWRLKQALKAAKIESLADRTTRGLRRASVVDFHAFRTTWITMALARGVPMELVRRVTGHATVEVVLKNYFRPGRAEFKRIILGAMGEKKKAKRRGRAGKKKGAGKGGEIKENEKAQL